jgi:hypothetical protein
LQSLKSLLSGINPRDRVSQLWGQIGKRLGCQGEIPGSAFKFHRLNPAKVNGRLEDFSRPGTFSFQKHSQFPAQGCVIWSHFLDRLLVDRYFLVKITEGGVRQFPVLAIFVPLIRKESKKHPYPDQHHLY